MCIALFARGIGLGSISIPSVAAAYASIPRPMIPIATTTINIVQRLGGPVATTLLAIYLHAGMQSHPHDISRAFSATFWLLCMVHLLSLFATLRLPARPEPHEDTHPTPSHPNLEPLTE